MSLVAQLALLAARIGAEIKGLVRPDDPGLARAWASFGVTRGAVRIRAAYNVADITRLSPGRYRVTFATRLPDANYCWLAFARSGSATLRIALARASLDAKTAAHLDVVCVATAGKLADTTEFNLVVYR